MVFTREGRDTYLALNQSSIPILDVQLSTTTDLSQSLGSYSSFSYTVRFVCETTDSHSHTLADSFKHTVGTRIAVFDVNMCCTCNLKAFSKHTSMFTVSGTQS